MSSYELIYGQDNPETPAHGWIQWKGTNVCMDTHCICGYHGHVDKDFFYRYECPKCHRKYAVGQNIKLIEMTPQMVESENAEPWGPHDYFSDTPDDDGADQAREGKPKP